MHRAVVVVSAVGLFLTLTPAARAATLYAAANGVDHGSCGTRTAPCRSITRTIANAAAGDKIVVGPGRYDVATETSAPGCGCMLALNKPVNLESSHGAAQTWIDGSDSPENTTLLVITIGGSIGKPGKGFTITQSRAGNGVIIDAEGVAIRGNQIVSVADVIFAPRDGVVTVDSPGSVVLEGNQVTGWGNGVVTRGANKTVRNNVVGGNVIGITAAPGSTVTGNVVLSNGLGILLPGGPATIADNAVLGNAFGISNRSGSFGNAFTGRITRNNITDNTSCGIENSAITALAAPGNYWGAVTGPGPDPADDVCNKSNGTTLTADFATKAFKVKPAIKP